MPQQNTAIPAQDFWQLIAKPSVNDFYDAPTDFRRTVIAVWALDALISHICWETSTEQMKTNEVGFLQKLASDLPAFGVIKEASNCLKHAVRQGKSSKTTGSAAVSIRGRGFGEAEWGVDEYGGNPMALVDYINGESASIKYSIAKLEPWIEEQLKKK
jgi:hypothetical protein